MDPPWVSTTTGIKEVIPDARIENINPLLDELRIVKSDFEIEMLTIAGRIGAKGVFEAIKSTKPNMFEYQIEAIASYHYTREGARGPAFPAIVASGPNTYSIHYDRNDRLMKEGDFILMDYGCDYNYYTSDITRVWPVSGRFSESEERMYRCILKTRNKLLDSLRPGIRHARIYLIGLKTLSPQIQRQL